MSRTDVALPAQDRPIVAGWRADVGAVVIAACFMVAVQAAGGFPTLFDSAGDNDSLMRLVQIRDWLGGQGWGDLHQYRMGPAGGFVMHWSRIVDVPAAALVLAFQAITGDAALGERIAELLWPAFLYAAALSLLVGSTRKLYGPQVFLPALVIGGITLNFMGLFTPRALDHHNLQLVLLLAAFRLLLAGTGAAAALAGACAALMLAVGMETLPYVGVAGVAAALAFLVIGRSAAPLAAGFGLGFAAMGLAALVATVPPSSWWAAQCDAYSAGLASVVTIAGFGLAAAVASSGRRGVAARLGALVLVAGITAGVAVLMVPHCFGDPYAGLDPRLRTFWLDSVIEAQSLLQILSTQPKLAPQNYATPLLAFALIALEFRRRGPRFGTAMLAGFLAAAFAVSVWQVRGSTFSLTLATMPLAAWVAGCRAHMASGVAGAAPRMVLAWLLSLSMAWGAAAHGLADLTASDKVKAAEAARKGAECYVDDDFALLATQPATTVLAISNLGSSILANTPHRVLAGPYHRNVAGNLLVLDAFMGDVDAARRTIADNHVGILAMCPGNGETAAFASDAPSGFMASLAAGRIPDWLEPIRESMGQSLQLYRVR